MKSLKGKKLCTFCTNASQMCPFRPRFTRLLERSVNPAIETQLNPVLLLFNRGSSGRWYWGPWRFGGSIQPPASLKTQSAPRKQEYPLDIIAFKKGGFYNGYKHNY